MVSINASFLQCGMNILCRRDEYLMLNVERFCSGFRLVIYFYG